MIRRLFLFLLSLAVSLVATVVVTWLAFLRPIVQTWGKDPQEGERALPGDDLVDDAPFVETRGITIEARPEDVWPWLAQMGFGRGGWYSYDQMDDDHPSADRVLPEFQDVHAGDILQAWPGGGFRVEAVEPGHSLSLYVDDVMVKAQQSASAEVDGKDDGRPATTDDPEVTPDARSKGPGMPRFKATWTFVLEPRSDGRQTRVIERIRAWSPQPTPAHRAMLPMFGLGAVLMTRKQLLSLKERVERDAFAKPAA